MGFDGSNKASMGGAQNIPYWECDTDYIQQIKQQAMAIASPEAISYIDPPNFSGPKVLADASTMTEEEWLAFRKKSIGSSAVAQVFGDSPYPGCTNLDLYYDKIGRPIIIEDDPAEKERKERMFYFGHLMEDYLHLITKQLFPAALQLLIDTNIYADPQREYLTANLDRMIQLSDGSWVHVEYKTSSEFNEESWKDGKIPMHYKRQLIQCQHIMGVWVSFIIVAFSRDKYLVRRYIRDLDAEYEQILGVEEFWNKNVLPQIPPLPVGNASSLIETTKRYSGYGDKNAPKIKLDSALVDVIKDYKEVADQISALESQVKKLKEHKDRLMQPIAEAMGTSVYGSVETQDGHVFEVKYMPRAGRRTIDLEKLEINHPDIYQEYVTQKAEGSRSMTISVRKKT